MKEPVISVVIATKERINNVLKCVRSILNQIFPPHEIIIIDSSKNTDLNSALKTNFPKEEAKIKYIHFDACLTAARNKGVQSSSGDLIFFFDDDVILEKNYIKEVVKVFMNDKDGKIGGVMGQITNVCREDQKNWRGVLSLNLRRLFYLTRHGDGKMLPSGLPTYVHGEKKTMKVECLSGCMMAYRRNVFDTFMFDEQLGKLSGYCYMEDVDFSYRVSRRYVLMYTPFAKLEHNPPEESTTNSMSRKKQFVFNHFYLFKKNMPKHLSNVFAFCLSTFGLLLLTLLRRTPKETVGVLQGIIDATLKL